jgi:hypothetical protein
VRGDRHERDGAVRGGPYLIAALHWTLISGARHGEEWDEWRAEEWQTYSEAPDRYESPLSCSTLGLEFGWGLRHRIEGWPESDCPLWMWMAVRTFLDYIRSERHALPHGGGLLDQPARLMHAFRLLDGALSEIRASERKSKEFHEGNE